jgi:hypothetical protein
LQVAETKWLYHVGSVLKLGLFVANKIEKEKVRADYTFEVPFAFFRF